jgi:hypothetical protein
LAKRTFIPASAVLFAKKLKAGYLILHCSGDEDVDFRNSEELVNALYASKPFTMVCRKWHALEFARETGRCTSSRCWLSGGAAGQALGHN